MAIFCCSGGAFSNEVSDCISNILWICSQVPQLGDLKILGSTEFFTPHGGFPLITLSLGILHCLLFQDLKDCRFLDVFAKFVV